MSRRPGGVVVKDVIVWGAEAVGLADPHAERFCGQHWSALAGALDGGVVAAFDGGGEAPAALYRLGNVRVGQVLKLGELA